MPFMFMQTPQRPFTTSDRAVTYPPTATDSGSRPTVTSPLIWGLQKQPLKPHPSLFHCQICIPVSGQVIGIHIVIIYKYIFMLIYESNQMKTTWTLELVVHLLQHFTCYKYLGFYLRHDCFCLRMLLYFINACHEGDRNGGKRDILIYIHAQNIYLLTTGTPLPFKKIVDTLKQLTFSFWFWPLDLDKGYWTLVLFCSERFTPQGI